MQIKLVVGVMRMLTASMLLGITHAAVVMVTNAMGSCVKVRPLQRCNNYYTHTFTPRCKMSVQMEPAMSVMRMLIVATLKEVSPAPVRLDTKEMDLCVKVKHS